MDFIIDAIVEWLKGLLVDGIMGNLDGLFDNVNQSVGEIATQVGTTPADWNAGVFSMIRQISETAILPIAGVILTFVMTYELIQMLIERNNLHEVDTWMFFKWVFKTFVAVMILTNTFNIVLAVFDVSQHVIQQSAGIIQNGTEITPDVLDSLRTELEAMELGPLFGLWLQSAARHRAGFLHLFGDKTAHGRRRCRSDRPSAYPSAVRPVQLSVTRCPFSRKGADVWTLSSTQSLNG